MFGKHFQSMYTGSMVGAGVEVFALWGYVISNTRMDSHVELNPPIVAAILGCDVGIIKSAIEFLVAPDPQSRSHKEEGRRLVQVAPFLYLVPTFSDYRSIRNENDRREYMQSYMQNYRAAKRVNINVNTGKPQLAHTEAEAEAEALNTDPNGSSPQPAADDLREQSERQAQKNPIIDQCPHQAIIAMYHEVLPELPAVRIWNDRRRRMLRAQWKDEPDLGEWRKYFEHVKKSKFLKGQAPPVQGRPPFVADLEWLINDTNMTKVIEGKYHRG